MNASFSIACAFLSLSSSLLLARRKKETKRGLSLFFFFFPGEIVPGSNDGERLGIPPRVQA